MRPGQAPARVAAAGADGTRAARPASGRRVAAVYVGLVLVPIAAVVGILLARRGGDGSRRAGEVASNPMLPRLLLAMVVVVGSCKAGGAVARRLGQPPVVGEIAAGILLGPSVLGALWPAGARHLIAPAVLPQLNALAQVGVVLFVFLAGLELDTRLVRAQSHLAVVVSHVSIAFPLLLGVLLALAGYRRFAPAGVDFLPFALFLGVSMSVTALPVMARLLMETGMLRSEIGTIALTCALVDDVTAWCLLALVTGLVAAGSLPAFGATVGLTLVFAAVLLFVVRPWLARASRGPAGGWGEAGAPLALVVVLVCALATERIGVHAIFGAFLCGLIFPVGVPAVRRIGDTIGGLTVVLLLPLFFAYSGLRTEIGVLGTDPVLWLWCLLILAVAVLGKLAGSALAARSVGTPWRRSLQIGALMNCRGLTELVVLNVGLDLGVLSRTLFTMLVLMALVSTAMTGPLLALVRRGDGELAPAAPRAAAMAG
ncbi:MAG: cation:proton antiporter [Mycobacteriales bacterium]